MEIAKTYSPRGAKQVTLSEPCEVCSGRVVCERDPDCKPERVIPDITFCTGCATIFSPWTMEEHRRHQERVERHAKAEAA